MGNYSNELRRKTIRPNNLLQFIHQVTIEFKFRKSLAQERFKSNLEVRYQKIVSSVKFRKGFAKIMIPIAFFKKFLSLQFIASVEVSNMARCSSKRISNSVGCRARNITDLAEAVPIAKCKWVCMWLENVTITGHRETHGTLRKRHIIQTDTRQHEHTSSSIPQQDDCRAIKDT